MAQRVIPEWSGPKLLYVEPTQAVKSFGYAGVRQRTPETYEYLQNALDRATEADGEVSSQRADFPDPETSTATVKSVAQELGAELVGITHVDQYHVYKGEDVPHKYAIVIAVAMDYDAIKQTPNINSSAEILRIYNVTGSIVTDLAKFIRGKGYPARAHTLRFEQLNMLPHAYAAGLGELGKHGSLINRELGSSFRVAIVTTDLPLVEDSPRLEGIDDFCAKCQMCVDYCPGDAISHDKQDVRGIFKWVVDTEACAPYWGTYFVCGICLQVCPYNAKGFGGKFRDTFIQTIKGIDLKEWRAELKAGLQEPWSYVERPTEFSEGWRMAVKGKGIAAQTFQGKPADGVVRPVPPEDGAEGESPATPEPRQGD